jgi:hypothetical protein
MRLSTTFRKLNRDWNAEPNAPEPSVRVDGRDLILSFEPNGFVFPHYEKVKLIELTFTDCARYRLGPTNDEGWYRGQCRFSKLAPKWGEFYEVEGDLRLSKVPDEWTELPAEPTSRHRHYLFYFRDDTFECDATGWTKRDIS